MSFHYLYALYKLEVRCEGFELKPFENNISTRMKAARAIDEKQLGF